MPRTHIMPHPNFIVYTRVDGSTFIVGRAVGVYVIVGHADHWPTRREAVAAGHAMGRVSSVHPEIDVYLCECPACSRKLGVESVVITSNSGVEPEWHWVADEFDPATPEQIAARYPD